MGAPEAETAQAGVYRGGAVYKCDIAADDRCNIIHFDDKGNEIIGIGYLNFDRRRANSASVDYGS